MSLYINGEWIEGRGERLESTNPASGEVLWSGAQANSDDVALAVEAAVDAFPAWKKSGWQSRLSIAEKYKGLLERDKEELAWLIADETGKPYWEALTEVAASIGKLVVSVEAYEQRSYERHKEMAGGVRSSTSFRAIGPMGVFGPFNLPVHLPNGHIIPALLAGNTVVLKPSEQTPASCEKMVKLWHEAGIPAGVVNLVQGAKDTGVAMVEDVRLKGILFTGSYPTGRAIHKAMAGQPERMLALEMGGNNPLLVWEVEDIKAAAYTIIQSAFITSGQRCVCARRLIISDGEEGDRVLAELVRQTRLIRLGLPRDKEEPFMGPLISSAAAEKALHGQVQLEKEGAEVLLGMQRSERCAALVSPGIVDVTAFADREDEEIFAPLLQVVRVADFEAAIIEAEATEYGLAAGLLSDKEELFEQMLEECSAGVVNWNRQITGAVGSAPFGGSGKSGNYRPGAYLAADYCAYPTARLTSPSLALPENLVIGCSV